MRHATKPVLTWLLDADPAIRWQVLRDLTDEPDAVVAAERSRIASEGWGARLLCLQGSGGQWGAEDDEGWMTTVDALALLKDLGADPAASEVRRAVGRVRDHITWWQWDGQPFFDGEVEACINGRILAAGAYFGEDCDRLAERLLGEQLEDGGWNCDAPASRRSSFHSTICVLEGLLEYERALGEARGAAAPATQAAVARARLRGQEYLLARRMFRSLSTGAVIERRWTRFAYPPIWHYDVLRGLDYLRSAGAVPDERVAEALEVVEQRRHQNGRWPLNLLHPDRLAVLPFAMETGVGSASRWNSLRALRVLDAFRQ